MEAERWLAEAIPGYGEEGEWYLGRPLLVTANDYDLGLYNGDTGVMVETRGRARRLRPRDHADADMPRSGWMPCRRRRVTVHRSSGQPVWCAGAAAR